MPFITVFAKSKEKQITWEDLIFGAINVSQMSNQKRKNPYTITRFVNEVGVIPGRPSPKSLILDLQNFTKKWARVYERGFNCYYRKKYIPKKSGGWREINEPQGDLRDAQTELKRLFEDRFMALYHTSAYAYVKGRCNCDAMAVHRGNESNWFFKSDFSDFFGSTTKRFVMKMLSMIYPFSDVMKLEGGAKALSDAIDVCFLNGGLPQGTTISPMLTNLMMIPFDHKLSKILKPLGYAYTRYADDIQISHKKPFSMTRTTDTIKEVLKSIEAPFTIKDKKTHYGSKAGSNWNLGLMLNKDNQITIGYKRKKELKAMMANYIMDRKHGQIWEMHEVQVLRGRISYLRMVEKDYADYLINHYNKKFGVDILKRISLDLKGEF